MGLSGCDAGEPPHPERWLYRCNDCRKHFSVKHGTVMQSSKLGCRVWAIAVYLLTTGLKGTSGMHVGPHPGLPPSPYGVAIGPQTARNLRPLQTGLLLEPLQPLRERFQEPIPVWLIPREIRIPVGAPASPIPSNVLALLVPSTDPAR